MEESDNIDNELKENYIEHQKRKIQGREEKQRDKEKAKKDKS